jgi:hypothetical protein
VLHTIVLIYFFEISFTAQIKTVCNLIHRINLTLISVQSHSAIAKVLVVGIPDTRLSEKVVA